MAKRRIKSVDTKLIFGRFEYKKLLVDIIYSPSVDECGVKLTQDFNIIGGEEATPNDYPWMVCMILDLFK